MPATKIYEAEMSYHSEFFDVEDGGCAQIYTVIDGDDANEGMFVKVQSWSIYKNHPEMDQLKGKRVRVTVEILDD